MTGHNLEVLPLAHQARLGAPDVFGVETDTAHTQLTTPESQLAKLNTPAQCAKHVDRPAIGLCDRCRAPFCAAPGCRFENVVADEEFCSRYCQEQSAQVQRGTAAATDQQFLQGFEKPIRTGWRLWAGSVGDLCTYIAPLAVVLALLGTLAPGQEEANGAESLGLAVAIAITLGVTAAFGIALTQVVLSQRYTGLVKGNPYGWTLERFIPWGVTSILSLAATFLGMLAFIVPGIIVGLRLFWADEFALVHRAHPMEAIRHSWQLTRGRVGAIFVFQLLAGMAAWVVLIAGSVLIGVSNEAIQFSGDSPVAKFLGLTVAYLVAFVAYGALHGPEIAYFYGMKIRGAFSPARDAMGSDPPERACPSCRVANPFASSFCSNCGAALS